MNIEICEILTKPIFADSLWFKMAYKNEATKLSKKKTIFKKSLHQECFV